MTASSSATDVVKALGDDYIGRYPSEAAHLLEEMETSQVVEVLEAEAPAVAAGLIQRMHPDRAVEILQALRPTSIAAIDPHFDIQVLAGMLARMEQGPQQSHLEALDKVIATELKMLMSYPPDSAGALMDPRTVVFHAEATADDALQRLRSLGRAVGEEVQVIDSEGRLLGRVSVQALISAPPGAAMLDIARPPVSVVSTAGLDEILEIGEGSTSEIGVVDIDGHLLGIIRRSRLTSAAEAEASAGLQTMVGVSKEERALSSASFAVKKRLPWLYINLITAFLAASVVGIFESTIAQVTALAVLLPVVAGQSGNSGSQALAVAIRGLALREVRSSQWRRLAGKELAVGLVNGAAIAVVTALGVIIWSGSMGLGVIIAGAMVASMAIAGIAGAGIPLILRAFGQDPAQSSSIFLTTVTDVVGFASFLSLATIFSGAI